MHCSENPLQTGNMGFITGSSTFQGNTETNLWIRGYTPFIGPRFQNKIKDRGKGETEAENEQTEESRKVLTSSLSPYIRYTYKIKIRGNKEQKCVLRMLKFESAMLEYLQNLNHLFGPIFSEKNQNPENIWSLPPKSEIISVHCSVQQGVR